MELGTGPSTGNHNDLFTQSHNIIPVRCIFAQAVLILVPTCPKNRKNRGFLRFPDIGILKTIAILRTVRFAFIVKIAYVWDVWDSTFKVEMIPILPITS